MDSYRHLLAAILNEGEDRADRTGVGTRSLFGQQLRFDLCQSFPLLTLRRLSFRAIKEELFWFIRGETNIRPLLQRNVRIWTDWPLKRFNDSARAHGEVELTQAEFERHVVEDADFAAQWGNLGPVYGAAWRSWAKWEGRPQSYGGSTYYDKVDVTYIDQLANVVESIRKNPLSRRHIVSAWNPAEVDATLLPPCHILFQFYVSQGRWLSCHLYQRSADVYLGLPFNIASYALLTAMIAHVTGLEPRELIISIGDAHLYANHLEQANTLLALDSISGAPPLPTLRFVRSRANLFDFQPEDIELLDYNPYPRLDAPVAV